MPIAADESIRRAEDPYRVRDLEAADVAVLKVQPLGGVRACLRIAEEIGMPVVVSSALETSIGIAAGVALAAALPELDSPAGSTPCACSRPMWCRCPLVAGHGVIRVRRPEVGEEQLDAVRAASDRVAHWRGRVAEVEEALKL